MNPVSCVSYVSWMHRVNAAETHETFHWESGMRYHFTTTSRASTAPDHDLLWFMRACISKSQDWSLIRTLMQLG